MKYQDELDSLIREVTVQEQINIFISEEFTDDFIKNNNNVFINTIKNTELIIHNVVNVTEEQISTALIFGKKIIKKSIKNGCRFICFNSNDRIDFLEEIIQDNPINILKTKFNPNFTALVGMIMTCAEEDIMFSVNGTFSIFAFYVAIKLNENVKKYAIIKK